MNVSRVTQVYCEYVRIHLVGLLRFRLDMSIGVGAAVLENALSIVFLVVVFENVGSIAGWSFSSLLLMYALAALGRAVHLIFFDNLWVTGSKYVQQGELDRLLTRPVPVLFQLVAERVNVQGAGQAVIGGFALAWALRIAEFHVGPMQVALIPFLVAISAAVFVVVHLVFASASFWFIDSSALMSTVFATAQFGQYPLPIFPAVFQAALLTVIPFAFTGFIPQSILAGSLSGWWILAMVAALGMFGISGGIAWTSGLRRYAGTGT